MKRNFGAFKKFLNEHTGAGRTEGALYEDIIDGLLRLCHVGTDENAFAESEAIGLHSATPVQRRGKFSSGSGLFKRAGSGGRNAMPFHEELGESLRRLELRSLLVRTPNPQIVSLEQIGNSQCQ